jgi:hypothetical protein
MSANPSELLVELRAVVKDDRRKALNDAYLKKPDVQSIAEEALKLLSKAVDENPTA